jgi:hypothetical protein
VCYRREAAWIRILQDTYSPSVGGAYDPHISTRPPSPGGGQQGNKGIQIQVFQLLAGVGYGSRLRGVSFELAAVQIYWARPEILSSSQLRVSPDSSSIQICSSS